MLQNNGYVKLWRKILKSDMYLSLNSKQRDVMIQCLLLANYKKKDWEWKGKIFRAKRGQFITSLASLKKNCARDVSTKNIRTGLEKLKKWQFLASKSTKTGRLITVLKWAKYQRKPRKAAKQSANRRQTGGKQAATNKKYKEYKEEYGFFLKKNKNDDDYDEKRKAIDKVHEQIKKNKKL
ncbi:hypothetical protein CL633_04475 [bacterium]|jgi:hypothetical protein|nr:hypothetical protein [bacterium]|tara:strand:+ start:2523 stop:3062 length:540 start_codon:yes stop_codon:yes gene_type:complete